MARSGTTRYDQSELQHLLGPNYSIMLYIITETPSNYFPLGAEEYCIIDIDDNSIYNFYRTKEEAEKAFEELLMGA